MPTEGAEQKLESAGDLYETLSKGTALNRRLHCCLQVLRRRPLTCVRSWRIAAPNWLRRLRTCRRWRSVQRCRPPPASTRCAGGCAVAGSLSCALAQRVQAQVHRLQAHGLGSCRLERKVQRADARAARVFAYDGLPAWFAGACGVPISGSRGTRPQQMVTQQAEVWIPA